MVDIIYTFSGSNGSCCVAYHTGLLYGVRSTDKPCLMHPITFVDNNYKKYNHLKHLEFVKKIKPKYATVRDIMTPEQCQKLGIKYYSFKQILKFANELQEYAENVIVIPKYDVIDYIPDNFMLGYSVISSYGQTDIPLERFKNRRVHLLGGSPKHQYEVWQKLKKEVVSIDTNYINRVSYFGSIRNLQVMFRRLKCDNLPEKIRNRETLQLYDLGFGDLIKPYYVAFAINAGYYYQLFQEDKK